MLMLTHIGETLISEMFNNNVEIKKLLIGKSGSYANITAIPELKLNKCNSLLFDGAHKVDIAIVDKETGTCTPIEAKLGLDRLSKNEFQNRFLSGCGTSHKNTRITGSMISILERNLPDTCKHIPLTVTTKNSDYVLSEAWILLCRKKVLEKWKKNGAPNLSKNCKVIAFEDLAKIFGTKDDFNSLVTKVLKQDYYDNWISNN